MLYDKETPRRFGPASGPRPSRPNRSWPTTCTPRHRYNAACAAALAGCGQGKDDPPLDEAAKARWRKQAIDWLKADLAAWSQVLESGPPQARSVHLLTLQHWKADPDLAGLRDQAALAKLPEDEQKACRALWAEVDALLAKTGQKASP